MISNGKGKQGCMPQQKRAFVCKVCGKEGQSGNIRSHIEANHIDGISVPCANCEKNFSTRHCKSTRTDITSYVMWRTKVETQSKHVVTERKICTKFKCTIFYSTVSCRQPAVTINKFSVGTLNRALALAKIIPNKPPQY